MATTISNFADTSGWRKIVTPFAGIWAAFGKLDRTLPKGDVTPGVPNDVSAPNHKSVAVFHTFSFVLVLSCDAFSVGVTLTIVVLLCHECDRLGIIWRDKSLGRARRADRRRRCDHSPL